MAVRTLSIEASCGHAVEYEAEYKDSDYRTQRAISAIKKSPCDACEQVALAAQLGVRLPALVGSERQIAWAAALRLTFLRVASRLITDETSRMVIAAMATQAEAKYWIETRTTEYAALESAITAAIEDARRATVVVEETPTTPAPAAALPEHAGTVLTDAVQMLTADALDGASDAEIIAYARRCAELANESIQPAAVLRLVDAAKDGGASLRTATPAEQLAITRLVLRASHARNAVLQADRATALLAALVVSVHTHSERIALAQQIAACSADALQSARAARERA